MLHKPLPIAPSSIVPIIPKIHFFLFFIFLSAFILISLLQRLTFALRDLSAHDLPLRPSVMMRSTVLMRAFRRSLDSTSVHDNTGFRVSSELLGVGNRFKAVGAGASVPTDIFGVAVLLSRM